MQNFLSQIELNIVSKPHIIFLNNTSILKPIKQEVVSNRENVN